jgi:hypothetical protein
MNCILEVVILFKFRQVISEKSKKNLSSQTTISRSIQAKKKELLNERAERKVTTMVVFNGIMNFDYRIFKRVLSFKKLLNA